MLEDCLGGGVEKRVDDPRERGRAEPLGECGETAKSLNRMVSSRNSPPSSGSFGLLTTRSTIDGAR